MFLVSLFCLLTGGGKAYAGTKGDLIDFSTLNNYKPNGKAWKSNFTIDWDTQYLEIVIDATNCKNDAENIFTLTAEKVAAGNRVDWWGVYEGDNNSATLTKPARVHAYYKSSYINFWRFGKDTDSNSNHTANGLTSSNKSYIMFKVSKADGLQATIGTDGTAQTVCSAATLTDDFFAADMTIGSEEGGTRMNGTYTSVAVKNIGSDPVTPTNATITNVLPPSGTIVAEMLPDSLDAFPFTATKQFVVKKHIDWDTQKIIAQVDLSTCNGENDFFAMTTGAGEFRSARMEGSLANPNLHCYYTPNNSYFSSYFGYVDENGKEHNGGTGHIDVADKVVNLEFSKAKGSVFNGVAREAQAPTTTQWVNLLKSDTVKIGMGQYGKSTNATYNYIRIVSADYTTGYTTSSNVLNEAAENTFAAQDNVNISLKRSFVAGTWNTICLPFDVSVEVLAEKFGDVELCTLSSVSNNVMNFDAATSIEAGKPYLIKPTNAVANPTFESVNLVAGDPKLVSPSEGWGMKGTYGLTTLATDGTNLFMAADNKFKKPSNESQAVMKGMRAYFIVPIGTSPSALRANIDGVETAISAINIENSINDSDNNVYNLQGQRVGTTLQGLPRGLYIQNGKKMIIK